ncbi:hypothetical protein DWW50_09750 [Eubacterium sp. AF15-50]|nr:hypothetical protein DWW68_06325 [Eubacterium sp. AF16-48]RHR77844.1 hypothetical protein DWW50_09750 [Eubacterium sp. AF15-50]
MDRKYVNSLKEMQILKKNGYKIVSISYFLSNPIPTYILMKQSITIINYVLAQPIDYDFFLTIHCCSLLHLYSFFLFT